MLHEGDDFLEPFFQKGIEFLFVLFLQPDARKIVLRFEVAFPPDGDFSLLEIVGEDEVAGVGFPFVIRGADEGNLNEIAHGEIILQSGRAS